MLLSNNVVSLNNLKAIVVNTFIGFGDIRIVDVTYCFMLIKDVTHTLVLLYNVKKNITITI